MDDAQTVFQDAVEKVYIFSDRVDENTLKYIGIATGVFFIFLLFRKVFTKYILGLLLKLTGGTRNEVGKKIIEAFQQPLRDLFIVIGGYFAILFLGHAFGFNFIREPILNHIFKSAIIILVSWGFYNLTSEQSLLAEGLSERFNFKIDKIVLPFLSKIFRGIIIGLTICVVLDEWGYNVNGFIAGLGIGGLAFALAAQETLANLFGGFVIILDRPFSIGDYIKTPNVEGVVEDISFRSTRIRALDKGLVTEPNSTIAKSTIINWTKRDTRRMSFTIGLTYETTKEQMQNCVREIKKMLLQDENILEEGIVVNFHSFGSSSLDIFINCFTNTADWSKYLEIKENINFKIMDIVKGQGTSMALPSTSVYFQTPFIK